MVSKIKSFALLGINSIIVEVEATLNRGLPMFDIVGLPDAAVRESRERVKSSIVNNGFSFPVGQIVINLAPADIKKEGVIYDLPILLSVLIVSGVNLNIKDSAFVGELSLSGEVKPVKGVLAMTIASKEHGFKKIFVPKCNANEAAVIDEIDIIPVENIMQLIDHLSGKKLISPWKYKKEDLNNFEENLLDFNQVKGQESAKRALEVAVAGGHNILMVGPPGSGKSMLAKRIPSILPSMSFDEIIETTKIYSASGNLPSGTSLVKTRPFRSPHHTISPYGLIGGGTSPKPGEISLAHNGVLFLDELPEFSRNTMEALRQPLEDKNVTISRVNLTLTYPCNFMLVAAMNPCPCGYNGHEKIACTCSKFAIDRYLSKLSGPLLDRIDMYIEVPAVEFEKLSNNSNIENSAEIKARVCKARKIQNLRYKNKAYCNGQAETVLLKEACNLNENTKALLKNAFEALGLSARSYNKILKIARTIADLENCENISERHIMEALQYRKLNLKN